MCRCYNHGGIDDGNCHKIVDRRPSIPTDDKSACFTSPLSAKIHGVPRQTNNNYMYLCLVRDGLKIPAGALGLIAGTADLMMAQKVVQHPRDILNLLGHDVGHARLPL